MKSRRETLIKRKQDKDREIDAAVSAKRMSHRSEKLSANQRKTAWNEIFDVLLWSVSFATKSFDKDDCTGSPYLVTGENEYLDTTKAMPQLIRPQDLANVVQSLFYQLLPLEKRLSRKAFVDKMESFTAGHTFTHNTEDANNVIVEKLNDATVNTNDNTSRPQVSFQINKSFESLASFSSIAERREIKNTSSLSKGYSNISGRSTSALAALPSTFPINMLLNANNKSVSGQLKDMSVVSEKKVHLRTKRSRSSERRVASASELFG